jgi:hypothetical protein
MPQHSCAAGVAFAKRVFSAHMQVAFPALGPGGFQEPVMMRGTGFAKLNLLLELAVARWVGRGGWSLNAMTQAVVSAVFGTVAASALTLLISRQWQHSYARVHRKDTAAAPLPCCVLLCQVGQCGQGQHRSAEQPATPGQHGGLRSAVSSSACQFRGQHAC